MSGLSFREQAAISLACWTPPVGMNVIENDELADAAQDLADKLCEKWGCDWAPLTNYGTWQPPAYATKGDEPGCRRCGKRPRADRFSMQEMRDMLGMMARVMWETGNDLKNANPQLADELYAFSKRVSDRLHTDDAPKVEEPTP